MSFAFVFNKASINILKIKTRPRNILKKITLPKNDKAIKQQTNYEIT